MFTPAPELPAPPTEEWYSASVTARVLGVSGSHHAAELIAAGLLGEIARSGSSRQVRSSAVEEMATREPVVHVPRGALVLRTSLAQPETSPHAERPYAGWSEQLPEPKIDAVRGFYLMPDQRAQHVVDEQIPIVVTLKTFVVAAFLSDGFTRLPSQPGFNGGVRFDVGTDDGTHPLLEHLHKRRLQIPPGGPFSWLAP